MKLNIIVLGNVIAVMFFKSILNVLHLEIIFLKKFWDSNWGTK